MKSLAYRSRWPSNECLPGKGYIKDISINEFLILNFKLKYLQVSAVLGTSQPIYSATTKNRYIDDELCILFRGNQFYWPVIRYTNKLY